MNLTLNATAILAVAEGNKDRLTDKGIDPIHSALAQVSLQERAAPASDVNGLNQLECAALSEDDHVTHSKRATSRETTDPSA